MTLVAVHPGVDVAQVRAATGWQLRVAPGVSATLPPTTAELTALRDLHRHTRAAHADGRSAAV